LNKSVGISIICALAISNAWSVDLGSIEVEEKINQKTVENINTEEIKSADLAEILHKKIPSVNLVRRSGVANDIVLRGQKRDNIVITVDDGMVCGACPNRMDPPTSHVLSSNIDNIIINEGPFDVENFGSLSGAVKVVTSKPTKDLSGNIYFNMGSFGYQKMGATVSGGNDKVQALISVSSESGEQYEDGDGNNFAKQLQNATTGTPIAGTALSDAYKDMDAYEKKSFLGKLNINLSDDQSVTFSYTRNESDNILYPNSKMDAIYDDSNIFNLNYTGKNLGKYSDKLQIKTYYSDVEHPMSTVFRKSSGTNSVNEVISKLTTQKIGAKIINDLTISEGILSLGLDANTRNWDGEYIGYGAKSAITGRPSIEDVDTKNYAVFTKYNKNYGNLNLDFGLRLNDTTISTTNINYSDRNFNSIDANVFATYKTNNGIEYFGGIGKASRVPDGRELYFNSSMNIMSGNPMLDQTTNTEFDLGIKKSYESGFVKAKLFYSMLDDYIYFNKGNTKTIAMGTFAFNSFENIDAKIYGLELSSEYDINNNFFVDFGVVYQRGKKDNPLTSTNINTVTGQTTIINQTNTNLADINPLKSTLGVNYTPDDSMHARVELVSSKDWTKYDADNGEQAINGYNIVNFKAQKTFAKNYEITVGVDNIFDETYAVSNTYADLILLSDGTSGEVMLMNESGRYAYLNLKYKF
jgi:iron complex outermembrane receptor protein